MVKGTLLAGRSVERQPVEGAAGEVFGDGQNL